jgi:nitrous oxide reductase accessory protein NosL
MKKKILFVILAAVLFCMPGTIVFAQDDIKDHRSCANCGMDRKAFGYSRMLIQYEDGMAVGVCSLHCAVVELDKNPGHKVKALLVADRDSRTLIDVEQANWVMGGGKRGVMTEKPKWAFQSKESADAFIKANGGKLVTWAEALAAAREETAREHR